MWLFVEVVIQLSMLQCLNASMLACILLSPGGGDCGLTATCRKLFSFPKQEQYPEGSPESSESMNGANWALGLNHTRQRRSD